MDMKYLLALALLFSVASVYATPYTVVGDKVYVNDSQAYIEAPYQINSPGYVDFTIMAKTYTGNLTVVFGFDQDVVKPRAASVYVDVTTQRQINTSCPTGAGYWFNFTVNPRYAQCWLNNTNVTPNVQINIWTKTYDTGNTTARTITYTQNVTEKKWVDASGAFTKVNYNYDGKDAWYFANNVPFTAGVAKSVKVNLDFPYRAKVKYDLAVYPSSYGNNINQAIADGVFYMLDPFVNSTRYQAGNLTNATNTWGPEKNTTATTVSLSTDNKTFTLGNTAASGTDYQNLSLALTTNAAPSPYMAYANQETSGTDRAFEAFDGVGPASSGQGWYGQISLVNPLNLVIYLGAGNASRISRYLISCYDSYQPEFWTFSGSNDNSSWTTIHSISQPGGCSSNSQYITISATNNTGSYTYYRWSINDSTDATYAMFEEIQLYRNTSNTTFNTSANLYKSTQINMSQNTTSFTPSWHLTANGGSATVNATCNGNATVPTWTGSLTNNTLVSCPVVGDVLKYEILLTGNSTHSPTMQNLTIDFASNTAPNVTTPLILPALPYSTDNLIASTVYTDAESNAGTVRFYWYKNGTNVWNSSNSSVASGTNITTYLDATNTSKDDIFYVIVNATDGTLNSSNFQSLNVTIQGTAAANPTALTSPSQTKSSIYVTWTTPVDVNWNNTRVSIGGTPVANTTGSNYNFSGLLSGTSYNITIQSYSDDGTLNTSTYTSILQSTLSNTGANITRNNPPTANYSIEENATTEFNVTATDDDGGNLIVMWFKNGVSQLVETITSGASSAWNWVTGYSDAGSYNITVAVNDTYNTTTTLEWNITVEDTYPIPAAPVSVEPNGGQYEYSIPLYCQIDYVPVAPAHYEFVYSINGSTYAAMNLNLSEPYLQFDISNEAYASNFSFGCRVVSPTGTGNYTYSANITKINKNNFYLFTPSNQGAYQHLLPYDLGFVAELENSINASIAANFADCNGDGIWDYSWDFRGDDVTSARKTFGCVNSRGSVQTTIGMVMYKNNTESWDSLGCKDVDTDDLYCVVYKTYEVQVT